METTVGVFLCTGCEIGEAIDCEALAKVATDDEKVKCFHSHGALCGPEGLALIKGEIEAQALDRLVIAACSQRVKTTEFAFDSPALFQDRCGLRELVAWTQEPRHEDTQLAAEDYLRMSLAKVRKGQPPEPYKEETSRAILVVGGGWTGLNAALEAARAGYSVQLVEQSDVLGGRARGLAKRVPTKPPFQAPEAPDVDALARKAEASDKITVHLGNKVARITGQPGLLDVTLTGGAEFRVGGVVMAAGYEPYDPTKLAHLGYGASADVVTNAQFERMLKDGKVIRPSDGAPARTVGFLQCAGSRDKEHLPYCSGVCCAESLKQACVLRALDGDAKAYILYRDMRTPGQLEDFYKTAQDDPGVFLAKAEGMGVKTDGGLALTAEKSLLGDDLEIPVDLVVLATGMVPALAGEEARVLNLGYRQGPDMPVDEYGFPDSNFICFPYETRRTGMYAAGPVRQPMDAAQARDDATGAALKAIQAVEQVARGAALHPRANDLSYPEFFLQRCTQCKRCTEECPFGALDEDVKGTPKPNPNRCRRCGVCMGACPERIVSFKNYSVEMIVSMLKAFEMPEEEDEKPRILVLMCENDAYPSLDIAAMNRKRISPWIRIVPVRCLGSVNVVFIADSLSAGYDGVMLIGCKHGDDYQCHFVKGSELANKRMENVSEALQRLALESERVQITELALSEWEKLPQVLDTFVEEIEGVGPNPYKDM